MTAKRRAPLRRRKPNPRRRNSQLLTVLAANPGDLAAARRAFATFHGKGTQPRTRKVPTIPGVPVLVQLGGLREIVYQPKRGDRARDGKGRRSAWFHEFRRGAVVAAAPDGKGPLYLIPGPKRPFRVDWKRGIVG